jgi:hypothetical protein
MRSPPFWNNVFAELQAPVDQPETWSPAGVRRSLEALGRPALIVLDELDRRKGDDALTALADTVKTSRTTPSLRRSSLSASQGASANSSASTHRSCEPWCRSRCHVCQSAS